MLHIKVKGMTNAATCKHMLCLYAHPRPLGEVKGQTFFLKVVLLHSKLKGWNIEHHASTWSILTRTLDPWGGVKMSKHFLLKVVILHIKFKGKKHRAPCKHIFCPNTHLNPYIGSKGQNIFYECSHVGNQIKGKEVKTNIEAKTLTLHAPMTIGAG